MYCLYLRKSRTDLEAEACNEGDTLLRHEKLLLELAQRQMIPITKIYREIVSGETIAARPVIQKLLSEVEQGQWNGVLVMEIERLARGDTIDQGIVAQAFKYSGTKIITPIKIYDPSNEYDEEYFEFGLFMSRREFKTINRRIQRGRIASVKEGKFISSVAPYGYIRQKIPHEKGYTLTPHPEQVEAVKSIYHWYTTGYLNASGFYEKLGCMKIADLLNLMGFRPPKISTWTKSSVLAILKNPVYIGKIRWQYRREITTIHNSQPKKSRCYTNDYILVEGRHKAIIEESIFLKAQEQLKSRIKPSIPGNRSLSNPLIGLIFCSKCGTPLTRLAKNKKVPYDLLKCMNKQCHNISSPLFLVEELLIKELEKWIKNYSYQPLTSDIHTHIDLMIEEKVKHITDIQIQIVKKEKHYEKIYDFLETNLYTPEDFIRRKILVLKELDQLKEMYQSLSDELEHLKIKKQKIPSLPEDLSLSALYYSMKSSQSKSGFLTNLIERIEYEKNEKNKKGDLFRCNFTLDIYPKVY